MIVRSRNSKPLQAQNITAARVDHLPIVARYLRQLGLVEIVDAFWSLLNMNCRRRSSRGQM